MSHNIRRQGHDISCYEQAAKFGDILISFSLLDCKVALCLLSNALDGFDIIYYVFEGTDDSTN